MTDLQNIAKAIHDAIGYENNWPTPECTQCVSAAKAVVAALKQISTNALIAGSDAYFKQASESETLVDATSAAWSAILNFILVEK